VIGVAAIVLVIVMRNDETAPTPAGEGTVDANAAAVTVARYFLSGSRHSTPRRR
jgi:hypothetical protein